MNFLIKRIAFFALLSFAFFSCEDPKDIGLDLEPENQNFGVLFTEDLEVQTTTVLVDSVRTNSSPYFLAGRYQDQVLGTVTAKSFLQIRYGASTALDLGTSPTLDSLVLILDYEYDYGNTGQSQTLSVHRLTDSVRRKVYYNYETLPYEPTDVGNYTFVANTQRDTLRFRLSDDLGRHLMSFAGKTETEFLSSFYGLALMGGETDNGAIIAPIITANSTATVLRLYYRNSASTDPKTYDFYLDGLNFNHIQSDRTGGALAGLQNPYDALPSVNTNELSYVQAGIGLMTRIEFPDIQKLREKGNIGINRAELIISPVDGTIVNTATPPSVLTLYGIGTDNKLVSDSTVRYIPLQSDFASGFSPNVASYNSTKKTYTFPINEYINKLLYDPSATNGLFLSLPSVGLLSANSFSLPANTPYYERSVDRLVLGSRKHPTNPTKLRVYYTLVDLE